MSLEVRAGEIVGIAGVDGNGQTELIDALTGLQRIESGTVTIAGHELTHAHARAALDAGIGHIPEDRQRRGLVLDFSIAENIALHDYAKAPDSALGLDLPQPDGPACKGPDSASSTSAGAGRTRARGASRAAISRSSWPHGRSRVTRGAHRRAAHARARRRRHRVPPPPPGHGARRGARHPPRLTRTRRDPVALRPNPRAVRGSDRHRAHRRGVGGARSGSRCSEGGEAKPHDGPRRRPRLLKHPAEAGTLASRLRGEAARRRDRRADRDAPPSRS